MSVPEIQHYSREKELPGECRYTEGHCDSLAWKCLTGWSGEHVLCTLFQPRQTVFFPLWAEEHERLVNWRVIMLIRQQTLKGTRWREIYRSQNIGLQFSSDFWEWLFLKNWMKSWLCWSQWDVAIILNREAINLNRNRIPAYFSLHFHMCLFLVLWTLCIHSALQIGSFFSSDQGKNWTSVCLKHLSHLAVWLLTYTCKFIPQHYCGKG